MSDENLIPPERGKYDHGVQDLQPRQTRNLPCFHCGYCSLDFSSLSHLSLCLAILDNIYIY